MRRWLLACLNALGVPWGLAVPLPTMPESPYVTALKRETYAATKDFWCALNRRMWNNLHD